ncbi:unnamed protein product [Fraxinus pennsylvanica]|uniref:Dirigent protein n=1 Tax=Fraxinus pennsylvanica TaxID=56036 RepID=A0AAD1Z9W6_9LAMI|nr:unnamed protein product [Fraxinus pennsylvanica]
MNQTQEMERNDSHVDDHSEVSGVGNELRNESMISEGDQIADHYGNELRSESLIPEDDQTADHLIPEAGTDRNSEKVGRARGLITFTDLQESALTMNLNFVFTSGPYNGSTLCMLGRNPMGKKYRELAIVGGTGVFRMARGYASTNVYSYDVKTSYGVLEYNIHVAYLEGLSADQ